MITLFSKSPGLSCRRVPVKTYPFFQIAGVWFTFFEKWRNCNGEFLEEVKPKEEGKLVRRDLKRGGWGFWPGLVSNSTFRRTIFLVPQKRIGFSFTLFPLEWQWDTRRNKKITRRGLSLVNYLTGPFGHSKGIQRNTLCLVWIKFICSVGTCQHVLHVTCWDPGTKKK